MCNSVLCYSRVNCIINGFILCGTFLEIHITKVPSHKIVFNLGVELDKFYRFCHHCFPSSISSFPFSVMSFWSIGWHHLTNRTFQKCSSCLYKVSAVPSLLVTICMWVANSRFESIHSELWRLLPMLSLVSQVAYETKTTLVLILVNNLIIASLEIFRNLFSFPLKFTTFTKLYPGLEHFTLCMLDTLHDPTSEGVCVCARASVCVFSVKKIFVLLFISFFFVLNHFSCSFLYYTLV